MSQNMDVKAKNYYTSFFPSFLLFNIVIKI